MIVNNVPKYDHCKDGDPGNDACSINVLITVIKITRANHMTFNQSDLLKSVPALNRIVHL